jgi:hypothetical protein
MNCKYTIFFRNKRGIDEKKLNTHNLVDLDKGRGIKQKHPRGVAGALLVMVCSSGCGGAAAYA